MQIVNLTTLELMEGWIDGDPTARCRAAFPLFGGNGVEDSTVVYFELEPGHRLEQHTDSPEELLLVIEGEVEINVGEERAVAGPGTIAVVPPMAPHGARNVGNGTARVLGFFPRPGVVSTFVAPVQPIGERLLTWGIVPELETALA